MEREPAAGQAEVQDESSQGTSRRAEWPELLVDIGGADRYDAWLASAVRHPAPVTVDVADLVRSGARSVLPGVSAVVFSHDSGVAERLASTIELLRNAAPHVGIYVLAEDGADVAVHTPQYAVRGADEVMTLGENGDDYRAWRLRQRLLAPAPEIELRLLWRWFRDSPERPLIMHCVRNAFWHDTWVHRTETFGASRRTLQNRLAGLGLPTPGLIARGGRMMHAQELERRGVKPAQDIALMLGIPSAPALQRARRRVRRSLLERGQHGAVFASLLT